MSKKSKKSKRRHVRRLAGSAKSRYRIKLAEARLEKAMHVHSTAPANIFDVPAVKAAKRAYDRALIGK